MMIDIIASSQFDDSFQLVCIFSKDKPDTTKFIDYFKKDTLIALCLTESEFKRIDEQEYSYHEYYNITITQVRTWLGYEMEYFLYSLMVILHRNNLLVEFRQHIKEKNIQLILANYGSNLGFDIDRYIEIVTKKVI